MKTIIILLLLLSAFYACTGYKSDKRPVDGGRDTVAVTGIANCRPLDAPATAGNDTIIDADYSFEEATAGSGAPQSIIDQLALFGVAYLSADGKLHRGQILSNRQIADDIKKAFGFMLREGFVIEKAIPIVEYGWNDSLSMADNNSYSFCYRDVAYSKHAAGMAIDINPRYNPLRWKTGMRPNKPEGAIPDTSVNGTLYPGHPVVEEFRRLGFRWGHSFTKFYDDHHFEKR